MLRFVTRCLSSCSLYKGAYKSSGAFQSRPQIMKYGTLKSLAVGIPFIYLGSVISRTGAELLEEWDIFIPQDD
ncbi:unnamed protein product [Heterobilharzia americana]|nr:unnamed protein product [Heterobilharzia americana]CAH8478799.1 unnamed protein product [Heterobilharzia americana]